MGGFTVVLAFVVLETSGGDALHWDQSSVPFAMNSQGSADLGGSEFTAMTDSFQHWDDACSINYTSQGQTALGLNSIYDGGGNEVTDNNSIVVWDESGWVYGAGVIGITFTWYNPNDGVIGEADMILNGEDYTWTTSGAALTDVESIVTHEAGHYLGLGHTGVSEATMFATVEPGETKKRTLHQDDIDGAICIYDGNCVGTPVEEEPTGCGCTLSPKPRGGSVLALLTLGLAAVFARKRNVKVLVICIAASLGFVSTANATVMKDLSLAELAADSDAVVLGTVDRVETWTDGRTIQTSAYVVVHEILAGADVGTEIEVRTPGGELPAGVAGPNGFRGMMASGTPRFTAGDEVVLFVARRAGVLRVPSLAQGKFRVMGDGLTKEVRLDRDTTDLLRVDDGFEPVADDPLDGIALDDLRRALSR